MAAPSANTVRTQSALTALVKSRFAWTISVASVLLGMVVWDLVARAFSGFILAPPTAVLQRLIEGIVSLELPKIYVGALGAMSLGFTLAFLAALPMGFLIGRSRIARALLEPTLTGLFAIPIVAFVPFVIIWAGLHFEARVTLVFIMCVLDMMFIIAAGARDVDRRLEDVGRSFGSSASHRFRSITLPASLPFVFTALRIGVVRAVNAMITAELFFAAVNLGKYMKAAANRFDSAGVLVILTLLCLTGLGLQELVKWAEARTLPWHIRSES